MKKRKGKGGAIRLFILIFLLAAAAAGASVDALKAALASLKGAEGDFNTSVGITSVQMAAQAGQLYNLNGQKMQTTLKKGLYILNGKKVVMK